MCDVVAISVFNFLPLRTTMPTMYSSLYAQYCRSRWDLSKFSQYLSVSLKGPFPVNRSHFAMASVPNLFFLNLTLLLRRQWDEGAKAQHHTPIRQVHTSLLAQPIIVAGIANTKTCPKSPVLLGMPEVTYYTRSSLPFW